MGNPKLPRDEAQQMIDAVNQCIREGYKYPGNPSAVQEAGRRLKFSRHKAWQRVRAAKDHWQIVPDVPEPKPAEYDPGDDAGAPQAPDLARNVWNILKRGAFSLAELVAKTGSDTGQVLDAFETLRAQGVRVSRMGDRFDIPKTIEAAYLQAHRLELTSDENNRFLVGVVSDNHCGSKYERRDVLADLFDRFYNAGVTQVLHAGNWIDGDARFNRHDLIAHGVEMQCQTLAETWPVREGITTYAVTGDDHEGWYAQREGIDVGSYCEGVFRRFEREDWINLGYMEAHIPLINANSGKRSMAALVHPGGGSAYALSYSIQKIVEALEGGEKPAVGIYGHYHKMWAGNIRNVWCLQPGCTQDQTPFMRKNKLEAHVGGAIVELEQDPESGAIIGFTPRMLRYFSKGFYEQRWSHAGHVIQPPRTVGGV